MIEVNCQQYDPAWWESRRGLPTASEFHRIITPAKADYAESKADTYIAEIVATALGWKKSSPDTEDTNRGRTLEDQALRWLSFRHGIKSRKVGFLLADDLESGSSPDAMVAGSVVPVEVKAPDLHTLIGWKMEGGLPEKHRAQCHGHMWVTGADACIFVGYAIHPSVDNMMIEVKRDGYTDKLGKALERFTKRLREAEEIALGENITEYRDGLALARKRIIEQPQPEGAAV